MDVAGQTIEASKATIFGGASVVSTLSKSVTNDLKSHFHRNDDDIGFMNWFHQPLRGRENEIKILQDALHRMLDEQQPRKQHTEQRPPPQSNSCDIDNGTGASRQQQQRQRGPQRQGVEFIQIVGESGSGKSKLVETTFGFGGTGGAAAAAVGAAAAASSSTPTTSDVVASPHASSSHSIFFVTAKFDELHQQMPFAAMTAGFSDLIDTFISQLLLRQANYGDDDVDVDVDNEYNNNKNNNNNNNIYNEEDFYSIRAIQRNLHENLSQADRRALCELIPNMDQLLASAPTKRGDDHVDDSRHDAEFRTGLLNWGPANSDVDRLSLDRVKKVFKTLLTSIATVRPLVVLWDDLQWSDSSTWLLLQSIVRGSALPRVLFIGTVRDENIVDIQVRCEELATSIIRLNNLSQQAVEEMVCDAMSLPLGSSEVKELSHVVTTKTGGNPYFVVEFLRMLQEQQYLTWDDESDHWTFQGGIADIQEYTNVSPNVVALLSATIQSRLDPSMRQILSIASHLGCTLERKLLVAVIQGHQDTPEEDIHYALDVATKVGILESTSSDGERLKFAHDAVHDALYEGDHPEIHLRVARTIERDFPDSEAYLFAYTEHLSRASSLLQSESDRIHVARVNLRASNLARRKLAIFASAVFLQNGLECLDKETMWQTNDDEFDGADNECGTYQLALELSSSAALIAYCCGDFVQCNALINDVIANARCEQDKLQVYQIMVEVKGAEMEFDDAVRTGISLIRQLGEKFPKIPTTTRFLWVFYKTKVMVGKRTDEELLSLPELDPTNRTIATIIKILGVLCMYGVWTHNAPLIWIASLRMMQLTLLHGFHPSSSHALSMYAAILVVFPGYLEESIRFARLSIRMLDRDPSKECEARTLMVTCSCLLHHVEPLQEIQKSFWRSYESGLMYGDIANGLISVAMKAAADLLSGKNCSIVANELRGISQQMSEEIHHQTLFRIAQPMWQMAENLMGMAGDDPTVLTGDAMDEALMFKEAADDSMLLQYCRLCRLQLLVYFGNYLACMDLIGRIKKGEQVFKPTCSYYFFKFFAGLGHASIARSTKKRKARKAFGQCLKILKSFEANGNVNVPPLVKMLEAEKLVLQSKTSSRHDRSGAAVEKAFEAAIDSAREVGFCNIQALCCERYAALLLEKGKQRQAATFYQEAYDKYTEFGAIAKQERLALILKYMSPPEPTF